MNVTLFGGGVFADVIKDLVTRSFWIICVGSESNDKCPEEAHRGYLTEEKKTETQSRR